MSLNVAFGPVTTSADGSTFNVSTPTPYMIQTGQGSDEVTIDSMGRYQIDVFGDVKNYNPKDFPLLTITSNLGSKPMVGPEDTWIDEYEGDAWVDIKLDDLRESTKTTTSGLYGGRLIWEGVTTPASAGVDLVLAGAAKEITMATGPVLSFGFDTSADYIRGSKREVIRKLANVLAVFKYAESSIAGATKNYVKYTYTSGTSVMVFWCFENIALKCGSTYYQKNEIIAGIKEFYFNEDYSELVVVLDFANSNIDVLDATATNNHVLMQEMSTADATKFSAGYTDYYTRMSRMVMIGAVVDVPAGVQEGSNFSEGTGFIFGFDQYHTFAQIFQSDKYGITGTRLATKLRFKDEWLATRKRKMSLYKAQIAAAMLYGKAGITYDTTNGLPTRTMSGILDYEAFPIRYFRSGIPAVATGTVNGSVFRDWVNQVTYSLNAYRQDGSDAHTVLVCRDMLNAVSDWLTFISSTSSNVLGGYASSQAPPSGSVTLGLEITEVRGNYGTLRFVHEPALDYLPVLKAGSTTSRTGGVPEWMFSTGLNPRKVMIALDKAYIDFMTLRPDKIYGNIQDLGQDMFQEAIRGEHALRLRFPRNHAVIYAG